MTEILSPPAKPKRMSERRYRELYDSRSVVLTVSDDTGPYLRFRCAGQVSAAVIAATYLAEGKTVTAEYADTA